jgi:hypothetical protein
MIPYDSLEGSGYEENFILLLSKSGGHCGFLKDSLGRDRFINQLLVL